MPPETVAIAVLLLPQAPPVVLSAKVVVALLHTLTAPDGVIATGLELTVIAAVDEQVPTVYDIVAVPAETPCTVPDATLATAVLVLLHKPPDVASVKLVVVPVHTLAEVDVIAAGPAITVTDLVTEQLPRL